MSQNENTVIEAEETSIDGRTNEEIVAEIQEGVDIQRNKDILCRQNKGLVAYCIKAYISAGIFANQDERDEYMQEGYIGLLEAALAYKEGTSKFSSYAMWYIRKHLYDHLRFKKTSLYISRTYWDEILKFQKASQKLEKEGKEASYENIAQLLDVTPQAYKILLRASTYSTVISLNEKCTGDEESAEYWELLQAEDDTEGEVTQKIYNEQLQKALNSSTAVSKRVSKMMNERFCEGMSFKDIGKTNKCSHQYAQQAIGDGLAKMCAKSSFTAFFVTSFKEATEEAARRREDILKKKRTIYEQSKDYHKQYYQKKKAEKAEMNMPN